MTTIYNVVKTADATIADGNVILSIARTDGKKGKSGNCIVVPAVSESVLTLVFNHADGKAWITDCIDDLRSEIASAINKKGEVISSDKLGIDALLVAMRTANESQRMTKESITNWFNADLAPLVASRICEKMFGIADDKLTKLVEAYAEKFASLAGREVSMKDEVKAMLIKALELLPDEYEHPIATKVIAKLTKVEETTEILTAL
jgi:hypothetical protein